MRELAIGAMIFGIAWMLGFLLWVGLRRYK